MVALGVLLQRALPSKQEPISLTFFPGNQIPVECMDPVAVDLMNQYVPLGNRPDGSFQTVSGIHKDRTDQFTAKIDHRISDRQNLNVYYYPERQHAIRSVFSLSGWRAQPF